MAGFGVALYLMRKTVAILLLALIVSTVLDRPVDALERRRVPRILGTVLVYLAFFIVLAFLFYAVIPIAFLEFNNLLINLSDLLKNSLSLGVADGIDSFLSPNIQQFTGTLLAGGMPLIEILGKLLG